MDFIERLTPENLRAFCSYFLMGYVFRATLRFIRGAPKEDEIHTVVLAVVWSVVLSALLVLKPLHYPKGWHEEWHSPLALLCYVLYAASLGLIAGLAHPQFLTWLLSLRQWACKKVPAFERCLKPNLSSRSHTQASTKFFHGSEKQQLQIKLKSGKTYAGNAVWYESNPDGSKDLQIIIENIYMHATPEPESGRPGKWVKLESLREMLISLEDVETIAVVKPKASPSS